MVNRYLSLDGPGRARIKTEKVTPPGDGEVLVRIDRTAISAGTERLVFSGRVPADMVLDDTIDALSGGVVYPLRYGYTATGLVHVCGAGVERELTGRRVFLFHPHAAWATVSADSVLFVPEGVDGDRVLFFPSLETALTFVHDGRPSVGDAVLVLGQGLLGHFLVEVLKQTGADPIVAVDPDPRRRRGNGAVCAGLEEAMEMLGDRGVDHPRYRGFDLVYEVSGSPNALNDAVTAAGYGGTIVVGSWYGTERSTVALGGKFHRARLAVRSSQVSSMDGTIAMRWSVNRRTAAVWRLLRELPLDGIGTTKVLYSELPALLRGLTEGERPNGQIVIDWEENS